jgi:hypothetical protein
MSPSKIISVSGTEALQVSHDDKTLQEQQQDMSLLLYALRVEEMEDDHVVLLQIRMWALRLPDEAVAFAERRRQDHER